MTILRAAVLAIGVLLAGSVPWGLLATLNRRAWVTVPWALAPMAIYLWGYWGFIGGRWGSAGDAPWRRLTLRANALSWPLWAASMGAGLLGFAALVAMLVLVARLVRLPDGTPIAMPSGMPLATGLALLAMQSVVAGVTEEAAFRGYMQSIVERDHGTVMAVLASGLLFGLLHAPSHPGAVVPMLPYYVAVSAVYGGLTWAADSILPALVLHALGDVVVLTRWWLTGRPEWQLGDAAAPLVWDSGVDAAIVGTAVAVVALTVATAAAYAAVRRVRIVAR